MTRIQVRRDTSSNWTSNNPTPASGEMCYETDTGKLKIGNGTDIYTNLPYIGDGGGSGGTTDYTQLTNKPQINKVELSGNKTSSDLKLQDNLFATKGINIGSNYQDLYLQGNNLNDGIISYNSEATYHPRVMLDKYNIYAGDYWRVELECTINSEITSGDLWYIEGRQYQYPICFTFINGQLNAGLAANTPVVLNTQPTIGQPYKIVVEHPDNLSQTLNVYVNDGEAQSVTLDSGIVFVDNYLNSLFLLLNSGNSSFNINSLKVYNNSKELVIDNTRPNIVANTGNGLGTSSDKIYNALNTFNAPISTIDTLENAIPNNWYNDSLSPVAVPNGQVAGRWYPVYNHIFKSESIYWEMEIATISNPQASSVSVNSNGYKGGIGWTFNQYKSNDFRVTLKAGSSVFNENNTGVPANTNLKIYGTYNNTTKWATIGIYDLDNNILLYNRGLLLSNYDSTSVTTSLLIENRNSSVQYGRLNIKGSTFKASATSNLPSKALQLNYDTTTLGVNDSNQLYVKDNSGNLLEMMANAGLVTNFVLSWGTQKPTTDGTTVTVYSGTKLVCPTGFSADGKPQNDIYTLTEDKTITPNSNLILLAIRSGNNFNCGKFYIRANQSVPADKLANSWLYSKKDNKNYQYAATPTDPTFNQYDYIPAIGLIKSEATITDLVLNDNPFLGVQLYNTEN